MIELIGIMVAATHLGPINDLAQRHLFTPGVYVVTDSGITAGVYRNTLKRTSWQLGYTHKLSDGWAISGGLVTGYPGTSTGYRSEPSSKYPLPYVALSYSFGASGVRGILAPQKTMPVAFAWEMR